MADQSKNKASHGGAQATQPRAARSAVGSTLLGVLIGMALGLAIAVGVALYVTRAPVPFVNKQARGGERTDPAKAVGALPDPNKPLAGKPRTGVEQAGGDANSILGIFKDAPPVPPGAGTAPERGERIVTAPPVVVPAPVPAPAPAPRAFEPTRSGDASAYPAAPISSSPAVETRPPAAAAGGASPAAGSSSFVLQAGAFRGQDDADTMKAKLALLGFEARVLPVEVDGRPMYRVRVGPYGQIEDMNRARAKLAENGIEATVTRQR